MGCFPRCNCCPPEVPSHLRRKIDWTKEEDRVMVAAGLVNAAYKYIEDQDRCFPCFGGKAKKWCNAFGFRIEESITASFKAEDSSKTSDTGRKGFSHCIGIIFVLEKSLPVGAPTHVIAFRGTIVTNMRDILDDCAVVCHRSSTTSREVKANSVVEKLARTNGDTTWLAGHSLGAHMALAVGRSLAKQGILLQNTFLFNPPYVTLPVSKVMPERLFRLFKSLMDIAVAQVTAWLGGDHTNRDVGDENLSHWMPNVLINETDIISMGFENFFKKREYTSKLAMSEEVARKAATTSLWATSLGVEDAVQMIPSAVLWVNAGDKTCCCIPCGLAGHHLDQWYKKGFDVHPVKYPAYSNKS